MQVAQPLLILPGSSRTNKKSNKFLRFENIQVNLTNKNGQNALYYAQKNQSEEMISLLLSNGAKQRTPSNKYIKSNSFSRPVSLLGSKKYDVRKHSNKQRKQAAEKTVHFDSTTTPSITSNQSVSYDHSTNQNSSFTDSSREYIWHQNVLDLNRNRNFEPETKMISWVFKMISLKRHPATIKEFIENQNKRKTREN